MRGFLTGKQTEHAEIELGITHNRLSLIHGWKGTKGCAKSIFVSFEFRTDEWNSLAKTIVFRGGEISIDVVLSGTNKIPIPPEMLELDIGNTVEVSVYGSSGDGVVLCSDWLKLFCVEDGANPSGDESTDPTLPIWAQILAQIGDLDELTTTNKSSLVAAINEAADGADWGGVRNKPFETLGSGLSVENGEMSVEVDQELDETSTNAVANQAVAKTFRQAAETADNTYASKAAFDTHTSDKNNPHGVTAEQVGALPLTGGTVTGYVAVQDGLDVARGIGIFGDDDGTGVFLKYLASGGTGNSALSFFDFVDDAPVRLENIAAPTNDSDAANKQYVDASTDLFYCTVTGYGTTANPYVCDKTYAEIIAAYDAGKLPVCEHPHWSSYGPQNALCIYRNKMSLPGANADYVSFLGGTDEYEYEVNVFAGGKVNATISNRNPMMTGATATADGTAGKVPRPGAGQQGHFLRGDGTWAEIPTASADTLGGVKVGDGLEVSDDGVLSAHGGGISADGAEKWQVPIADGDGGYAWDGVVLPKTTYTYTFIGRTSTRDIFIKEGWLASQPDEADESTASLYGLVLGVDFSNGYIPLSKPSQATAHAKRFSQLYDLGLLSENFEAYSDGARIKITRTTSGGKVRVTGTREVISGYGTGYTATAYYYPETDTYDQYGSYYRPMWQSSSLTEGSFRSSQFLMSTAPTQDMEVATKKYVDDLQPTEDEGLELLAETDTLTPAAQDGIIYTDGTNVLVY